MYMNTFLAVTIVAMAVAIYFTLLNVKETKQELHSNCEKTSLRVYVGGRINELLPIYDCGQLPASGAQ